MCGDLLPFAIANHLDRIFNLISKVKNATSTKCMSIKCSTMSLIELIRNIITADILIYNTNHTIYYSYDRKSNVVCISVSVLRYLTVAQISAELKSSITRNRR